MSQELDINPMLLY